MLTMKPAFRSHTEMNFGIVVTTSTCRVIRDEDFFKRQNRIARTVCDLEAEDGNEFEAHVVHGVLDSTGDLLGFVKKYKRTILIFTWVEEQVLKGTQGFRDVYERYCVDYMTKDDLCSIHVVVVPLREGD